MAPNEIRYTVLFSIQLSHAAIRTEDDVFFEVVPTPDCQAILRNLRWLTKPFANGIWIVAPKRVSTGAVELPIDKLTKFSFYIRVLNKAVQMPNPTPVLRLANSSATTLYLSNMDANGILDNRTGDTPLSQRLTADARISPQERLISQSENLSVTTPTPPQYAVIRFSQGRAFRQKLLKQETITAAKTRFSFKAPTKGFYELTLESAVNPPVLQAYYLDDALKQNPNVAGIIEIFKSPLTITYNESNSLRYKAIF